MRMLYLSALALIPTMALAQATPPKAATAAPAGALSTSTTPIGDLLDNAAAKAVVQKHLPEVVNSDQIEMARGMTLKDIQTYAPDQITDAKLAAIDHDLAAIKK